MYKHILVPIAPDHAPKSGEAVTVARALLAEGGRITALTVLEAIPAYIANQLPEGQLEKTRAEVETRLKADLGGVNGVSTSVVVGHSANTILDQANAIGADCIIISSHRPGLQDYFLGSTAGRVVRHAQCSVHVVR